MKKTSTLLNANFYYCFFMLLIITVSAIGQPDYSFKNATLVSGVNLKAGSKYRFNNVKTGVDAFVTLSYISPGVLVTELDGASGYPEALQPTLTAQANKNGYLEMKIDFLYAGTNNPYIQSRVPVTCIDIDGDKNNDGRGNGVYEFDEVDLGGGFLNYNMLGNELQITQTGNVFRGINTAGIDYPGRDTIAKQVMFTAFNNNISSCIIRVGLNNKSTASSSRLRSVYFKEFSYPNGLLAAPGLLFFGGITKESGVELNWELAAECNFNGITIERSLDGKNFKSVGQKSIQFSALKQKVTYTDMTPVEGVAYYRLRLHYPDGKYNFSDVLILKSKTNTAQGFRVYPNLVESGASIMLSVSKNEQARLMIVDMSGRVHKTQQINLMAGNNSMQLNGTENLTAGNYLVVLTMGNEKMTQKIIKR
jgi:hypothetical protein